MSGEYKPSFDSDTEVGDEAVSLLKDGIHPSSPRRWRRSCRLISDYIWKFCTIFFGFVAAQSLYYIHSNELTHVSHALRSELEAARGTIEYHDLVFTSGIEEQPDGKMHLNLPNNEPAYVGPPRPEVDAAWDDLTQATEIWIKGDEAKDVSNRTISSDKGWLVSLDVYHSLHCVNLVRKGLDWDYYYGDQPGQTPVNYMTRDHMYHCLEHLRQVVMCHSDLTPMRFRWSSFVEGRGMPVWEEPHTCRNWEKVRIWAEERRRTFVNETLTGNHHHH